MFSQFFLTKMLIRHMNNNSLVAVVFMTVVNSPNLNKQNSRTIVSSRKQFLVHTINLIEIDGKGDFLCPTCQAKISPDDETEESYCILEPKVKNNTLEGLLIRCNNCANKIFLTGFSTLENI
jgi:hypothetical protein